MPLARTLYATLLSVVTVLVVGASMAQAHTTIIEPPGSHFPYQQWVDEAFVPSPDVTVPVIENQTPCEVDGAEGCVREGAVIELALPYGGDGEEMRDTFEHELGHVFDFRSMSDWKRARFVHLIRQPTLPWFSTTSASDWFADLPASEWFAESYSLCARTLDIRPHTLYNIALGVLGAPAMRKICGMLRQPT